MTRKPSQTIVLIALTNSEGTRAPRLDGLNDSGRDLLVNVWVLGHCVVSGVLWNGIVEYNNLCHPGDG